jgi:hypothetical protein
VLLVQEQDVLIGRNPHAPTFPDGGSKSLSLRLFW